MLREVWHTYQWNSVNLINWIACVQVYAEFKLLNHRLARFATQHRRTQYQNGSDCDVPLKMTASKN